MVGWLYIVERLGPNYHIQVQTSEENGKSRSLTNVIFRIKIHLQDVAVTVCCVLCLLLLLLFNNCYMCLLKIYKNRIEW